MHAVVSIDVQIIYFVLNICPKHVIASILNNAEWLYKVTMIKLYFESSVIAFFSMIDKTVSSYP